jgi:hypothetical protein
MRSSGRGGVRAHCAGGAADGPEPASYPNRRQLMGCVPDPVSAFTHFWTAVRYSPES